MFQLTVVLLVGVSAVKLPLKPCHDLNDVDNLFREFLEEHDKVYSPEEYSRRLNIFKENLKDINERNARHLQTKFGVNRFFDLTSEEKRRYLEHMPIHDSIKNLKLVEYPAEAITAPDQFDFRDLGVVTPVKDQLHCAASWVFSATGVMESQYALKDNTRQLVSLSAQQSIDCSYSSSNYDNCHEAWPHNVFNFYQIFYIVNGGVASENVYPYTARSTDPLQACRMYNSSDVFPTITNVTGFEIDLFKDEESLKQFLYEKGPVAIGLDSSAVYEYTKGIHTPDRLSCNNPMDVFMLLVGYGEENGVKYWTLKNSWGKDWGEDGYMRLVRGVNACSIGHYVTTCTVE